ncbi:MAG: geranylgeranylglyceryl/heptaprenylglyceryl phosphate synthase [Nitrososphaeria archaeon]|nr:geranylgeranylglyceryl/heptaprenylglyceryl phosphate synthase [Conexivisphaerales archaeon]
MSKISVYQKLLNSRESSRLCLPLLDPVNFPDTSKIAKKLKEVDTSMIDAFLVGGSTLIAQEDLDRTIECIKKSVDLPVIIFPNNINAISKKADAIFYMMLMNSALTYYIIDAQVLASPLIERYKLETIPTGYIVVNSDSAVSHIGHVRPIPSIPELISLYVLAAKHFGFKIVYLEGGSGTSTPITSEAVALSKRLYQGLLLVGGGITDINKANEIAKAGADGLVIGNLLEKEGGGEKFNQICKEIKKVL